jgi:opacity protein-like surface antigen
MLTVFQPGVASAGGGKGQFALTPLVGADMPIQYLQATDGGGRAKLGFNFGALVEYGVTDNIAVGGRFVYNRFGVDFEGYSDPDSWDGNWTTMEFGVFGRYQFMLPEQPLLHPFVRAGFIFGKADQEITSPAGSVTENDITIAPGGEIAGGVMYDVAETISVYGEIGWTAIATEDADIDIITDGSVGTGDFPKHLQWIGIKAGVFISLGSSSEE